MRILLLIVAFVISSLGFAQERHEIRGKVIVDYNDLEGITVFNTSTNRGTTTNEKGEFKITAGLNDKIEFAALQFKNFTITVDETIVRTKQMTVYLVEQVNKLPEVLILPYDLTGNLDTDLASIRTFNPDMDALYFGVKNSDEYIFPEDNRSRIENTAMHSQGKQQIVNGLNVINVVKVLISPLLHFESKDKTKSVKYTPKETDSLRNFYSVSFISTNFDIPTERVDEFINYVEANGLKAQMVNKDKELELLQFLFSKRDQFLAQDVEKD